MASHGSKPRFTHLLKRAFARSHEPSSAPPNTNRTVRTPDDNASWSSLESSFLNARDASATKLPSMAELLASFLGFAKDFEEIEDATKELKDASRQLDELVDVLNELDTRSHSNKIRGRLRKVNRYIQACQGPLTQKMSELRKQGGYLNRAAMAREAIVEVGKVISRVHSDTIVLHLKLSNMARDDDIIRRSLRPVSMAPVFASQDRGCMAGTRTAVLAKLVSWATDRTAPPIFWLSGMAGIGKTAIAQTFCDLLRAQDIFAPSFFCSRRTSVEDHQNVMRIIPTLSSLMAQKYGDFCSALLRELSSLGPDREPFSLTLEKQFRLLLQVPLGSRRIGPHSRTVFVIDALDELRDTRLTGEFIDVLLKVAESLSIKFFLTSRPEEQIRFRFLPRTSRWHRILRLHEVEQDVVKEDIRLYLTQKLEVLGRLCDEESSSAPLPWPTASQLDRLVILANNLFLYASTVVRYLGNEEPRRRLETLLNAQSTVAMASLDDTYRFILGAAFTSHELEVQEKLNRKRCLATLLCAQRPLSMQDMGDLLEMDILDVRAAFKPLHSVVQMPTSAAEVMSTFHASFQDYLTDSTRSGNEEWFVDVPKTHSALTDCCLRIIGSLRFNITQFESSYSANTAIQSAVSNRLAYGCQYGISHLVRSERLSATLESYGELMCEKFLYWLEVLSVLGLINIASGNLMELVTVIDSQRDDAARNALCEFLKECNEFVLRYHEPLSMSAPHVYVSVLPFVAEDSTIARAFWRLFPHRLHVKEAIHTQRQFPLLILRDHTRSVSSVAFSPDSTRIVSGSGDKTARVWDARTGKEVCEPLEGHTGWVNSVAFSPDSTRIVSGSADATVRVWDARTGKEVCEPLEGHTGGVNSVAFSPDATRIVSGSDDKTIRVWDARTGKEVCEPLEGHTGWINSVAFSPDSTRIVSGSGDKTVRVWDARTGKEVCEPLEGHTGGVSSVAFSPDSTRIVSGSDDTTVRVWDAHDEETLGVDEQEPGYILSPRSESTITYKMSPDWPHGSGWVLSSAGERLFWVPEEFRQGLCSPRAVMLIGERPCRVDLTRFVHGHQWTKCYTGP